MSQSLSSAAVVIGALRAKRYNLLDYIDPKNKLNINRHTYLKLSLEKCWFCVDVFCRKVSVSLHENLWKLSSAATPFSVNLHIYIWESLPQFEKRIMARVYVRSI